MSLKLSSIERRIGVFFVTPVGRIDSETAPLFESKMDYILESEPTEVIFDLEGVDYLSSAGIRVFFKTQKSLHARDGKVVLLNLQPTVRKVFEIINALPELSIFESIKELDAYLDKMQRAVKEQ
jgi:anti-sigma B factor antagonist